MSIACRVGRHQSTPQPVMIRECFVEGDDPASAMPLTDLPPTTSYLLTTPAVATPRLGSGLPMSGTASGQRVCRSTMVGVMSPIWPLAAGQNC
jgi:hypothetical protein